MSEHSPKIVTKPWGHEIWVADGTISPYAFKKLTFLASFRSSLHVHKYKIETNYIESGEGIFEISKNKLEIDDYILSNFDIGYVQPVIDSIIKIEIKHGNVIHVEPGYLHRVTAKTDLVFFECSTSELDDVFRIEDDSKRGHGKIDSEHAN
jgi:hypothetical protein